METILVASQKKKKSVKFSDTSSNSIAREASGWETEKWFILLGLIYASEWHISLMHTYTEI